MTATLEQQTKVKSQFQEAAEKIGLSEYTLELMRDVLPDTTAVNQAIRRGDVVKLCTLIKESDKATSHLLDMVCEDITIYSRKNATGLFSNSFMYNADVTLRCAGSDIDTRAILEFYLQTADAGGADLLLNNLQRAATKALLNPYAGHQHATSSMHTTPKAYAPFAKRLGMIEELYNEFGSEINSPEFKLKQRELERDNRVGAAASR